MNMNTDISDLDMRNRFFISTASAGSGFSAWVGPTGDIVYIPQGKDHMDVVFQSPGVFDLSEDNLHKYSDYKNSDDVILDE